MAPSRRSAAEPAQPAQVGASSSSKAQAAPPPRREAAISMVFILAYEALGAATALAGATLFFTLAAHLAGASSNIFWHESQQW